jgi:hypothetical protein
MFITKSDCGITLIIKMCFLNNKSYNTTPIGASILNQLDGKTKKVFSSGVVLQLAIDKTDMAPYEERIKYLLDTEGDFIVIYTSFSDGHATGVFSTKMTFKECAKQTLKVIFKIHHSSAIRNLKEEGPVLRVPLLIRGMPAELIGVKYSFIKTHPDLFPAIDVTSFDSAKSFSDKAVNSLSEGDYAIIIDDFYSPEENRIVKYESSGLCYSKFQQLCSDYEQKFDNLDDVKIEYPNSKEYYDEKEDEGVFERGNVMTFWINDQMIKRITMHICE